MKENRKFHAPQISRAETKQKATLEIELRRTWAFYRFMLKRCWQKKKLVQWLGWDLQTPIVDSRSEDGSFAYEASQLNFKAKLCVVFGYE